MTDAAFTLNMISVLFLMTGGLLVVTVLFAADDCKRMLASHLKLGTRQI